jgi:hypothetical protein
MPLPLGFPGALGAQQQSRRSPILRGLAPVGRRHELVGIDLALEGL